MVTRTVLGTWGRQKSAEHVESKCSGMSCCLCHYWWTIEGLCLLWLCFHCLSAPAVRSGLGSFYGRWRWQSSQQRFGCGLAFWIPFSSSSHLGQSISEQDAHVQMDQQNAGRPKTPHYSMSQRNECLKRAYVICFCFAEFRKEESPNKCFLIKVVNIFGKSYVKNNSSE